MSRFLPPGKFNLGVKNIWTNQKFLHFRKFNWEVIDVLFINYTSTCINLMTASHNSLIVTYNSVEMKNIYIFTLFLKNYT